MQECWGGIPLIVPSLGSPPPIIIFPRLTASFVWALSYLKELRVGLSYLHIGAQKSFVWAFPYSLMPTTFELVRQSHGPPAACCRASAVPASYLPAC